MRTIGKTTIAMALLLALSVATTMAGESKSEKLDNRVRKLMTKFDEMQKSEKGGIPAEKLKAAKGVIIMDLTKGGFVVGYEKGFGVAMVRDKKGDWSPMAFVNSNEGSFGAQIGGKSTFRVVLLMSDAARDELANSKAKFGGEAAGTGGEESGGVSGNISDKHPVLVFAESEGVYGGAVVKGGSVDAYDKANESYYGKHYSLKDILFDGEVKATETGIELAKKLNEAAKGK
jgi:lipid-binding SYLF domain-containing protein